jgi:tetratricopeptide (TPR) repeat protein
MKKRAILLTSTIFLLLLSSCAPSEENIAMGMAAAENLDYETALTYFNTAVTQGEAQRLIARGMGIAYMGMADYPRAISCFEAALSASNGMVEALDYDLNYYLAAAYTKDNQLSKAEAVYNAILALKPKEKDAYFLRGNVRLGQGRREHALVDFEMTVSLDAQNYGRLIQIYEVLSGYGYGEDGMVFLKRGMDEGENKMTAFDKGRIYYYMEKYEQAAARLEDARSKGDANVYLYLGKSYEALGENNYAASVYQDYISKDEQNAPIYNQLGLCQMNRGDYEAARTAFETGLALQDAAMMQPLSWNQIVVYEYLGEFQKANELLSNYLQKYPDDQNAKREKDFLSTR